MQLDREVSVSFVIDAKLKTQLFATTLKKKKILEVITALKNNRM